MIKTRTITVKKPCRVYVITFTACSKTLRLLHCNAVTVSSYVHLKRY
ncbi:hypothetical protein QWZ13_14845 [Reinekea marina]|nr:hypothetical protein [Reinekea marina]MDN3650194.1 hypothetical protein [Reinekea marina]